MSMQVNDREVNVDDLRKRLQEAEANLRAIYDGEVDAVVVNCPQGPRVYTLEGADHPYRVLVEQMHEGTVTLDCDRVILYCNGQFATMVGAPVESIPGSKFDRFLAPSAYNFFTELSESAIIRGHASAELDLIDGKSHIVPARISLTAMEVTGMRTLCLVASDLREQRRNLELIEEERLSRLMLDQAGEAIVVIDSDGIVLRCSTSAKNLAGVPILLNHFDKVFVLSAPDRPLNAARIIADARTPEQIRGLEAVLIQPDGACRSVLVSAGPLWSHSNGLLGCVVTLTDITRRKRAEEALEHQARELLQANSDLRQFAYSASHDLREPLRQLAVFSELLQKRYKDHLDNDAVQLIRHTVDSAHRAEDFLKGLLDYTQAAGAPIPVVRPCDANEVIRKTIETFESHIADTGAEIRWDNLPSLGVQSVHLTQLFQNLISNALKYRSDEPPRIHITAERDGNMWKIGVTDNGIGIAPDYREQVFHMFKRLHGGGKYSGSGIGLAICHKIVQRYGGRIWVEAAPGKGSKFLFTLPGDRE